MASVFSLKIINATRPAWARFLAALVLVASGAVVRLEFLGVLGNSSPYLLFFPAVILAALYGGRGPGLLATALAALTADYFWMDPKGTLKITHPADLITFGVFLACGSLIAWITGALLDAQFRARAAEAETLLVAERQRTVESQLRLAAIVNSSHDAIVSQTLDGIITSWNSGAEKMFGYAATEVIGGPLQLILPPGREDEDRELLARVARGEHIADFETVRVGKDGRRIHVSTTLAPLTDANGKIIGTSKIARDITGRKLQELEIGRMSRLYSALSQVNQSIVWTRSQEELFAKICQVMIEHAGFKLAWIGSLNPETKQVSVVAQAGAAEVVDYVKNLQIYADDRPEGCGPAGRSIRENEAYVCNDFGHDPATLPWRELAARHGLAACVSVPIRHGGATCGVLMVYAAENNFFGKQEVALLVEAALDISFALDHFTSEQKRLASNTAEKVSELRYRRLFETAKDGILILNATTGQVVDVNPFLCELLGRPRAQFLGQVPWQLVFFKDVAPTEASFHELSQQGHLHVDHLPLTTAQGRPLAVELVANSYAVEGDPVIQWHLRDITQRKQAEAALRESETRFRNLFQNNGSVMLLLDPETGEILDANQMAEAYYGYPLSALIGMPISRINLRPAQEVAVERELARREARNYFNFQHRLADGQIRDVEVYSTPVATGGKELLISIVHDITARKQTEQQLKLQSSALVAAANAIIITDRDAKIEWVNPAFSQLTGYAANEAIGQHMRLLKSGQHPPAFYSQMWATILSGQVWHGELVNKRKDGGLCTEDTTITPVRGADGQIAHFVAVKQNVTERRQMEQRIQQAEKMEAIGRLAGGIAHDFNNILAAMMGFSHLLQQDTQGNALAQESIAEILKATDRARELVGQILTFSRQREQSQRIIQLETVVKEAAKLLRASLPAQIKIELDLSSETPTVLADPTQIYQVTMNLATNALHAMEDCPGHLTLRLEAFQPSAEFIRSHPRLQPALYARLTVTDTGPGMDAKTLQRIFEPFFTTKPVGKGTGLGLAVVHGIVESHGGLITVESAVGHGTKFCLYFPARTGEYTLSEPAPVQPRTGQGQKILLVDDEPALTSAFQKMLQRLNYSVTPLNSAREALALFQLNPGNFDVLITDLTMPEMNGLELARRIHACRPQLPVILASGYSPELQRETSQVADICELLEKPVSLTSLASALQRALTKAST